MFEITHLCTLLLTLSIIRELSQGWVTFYILSCYMLICRPSDMYLKLLHPFLLIFNALGWANNVLFHHISHLKNTSEVYQPLSTWSKVETCRHEGWFIGGPMLKICYQGYPLIFDNWSHRVMIFCFAVYICTLSNMENTGYQLLHF